MYKADYEHLKHEFENVRDMSTAYMNPIDAKVHASAVNKCIEMLTNYWEYCDCINSIKIPGKDPAVYKHNSHVYGDELVGYSARHSLYGGDCECKHEVYGQVSGGVKCIKCGAWYCA